MCIANYLYVKIIIHTCTVQKLIVRKIIFENSDYENYPNYGSSLIYISSQLTDVIFYETSNARYLVDIISNMIHTQHLSLTLQYHSDHTSCFAFKTSISFSNSAVLLLDTDRIVEGSTTSGSLHM